MMAGKIKATVGTLSSSLLAAQHRTPFTSKLPESEALTWWAKNRETPLGQQAYLQLPPEAQANLDYNLTLHAQSQDALGMPVPSDPPPMGG